MPYKIILWTDINGIPYIGATRRDWRDVAVDSDHVFGIQIGHRVVATTPEGYRIMTPRDAARKGYMVRHFAGPKRE